MAEPTPTLIQPVFAATFKLVYDTAQKAIMIFFQNMEMK